MTNRLLVLLALLVGQALTLTDTTAAPQRDLPEYFRAFRSHTSKDNITRAVFRNGLTVVVEEHPSASFATVATTIEAGSVDKRSTKLEAEIVAEILAFRLTESIYPTGGRSSYQINFDRTHFFSTVPEDELIDSLSSHRKIQEWEPVDQETVMFAGQKIRRMTVEEKPGRINVLFDWILGERRAPVPAASPQELKKFHATYYHPQNVTITVTGSVRRELVLSQLAELLGKVQPGKDAVLAKQRSNRVLVGEADFRYRQIRTDVPLPVTLMAAPIPGPSHRDSDSLVLLQKILGEGLGALWRLPQREEDTPLFFLDARIEYDQRGNLFVLGMVPKEGELDRAEARLLGLLEALRVGGIPLSILTRAKSQALTEYYRTLESFENRALRLLNESRNGAAIVSLEQGPEKILEVTSRQIQEMIGRYFSPEKLSILEFLPASYESRTFTPETYREAMEILLKSATQDQIGFLETFRELEGFGSFSIPEHEVSFSETDLKRSSVLRGPEIYIREKHTVPVAHYAFFFAGGRALESEDQVGITELLLRSLAHRMSRKEAGFDILQIEAQGATFELVNEPDFFGFQLALLSNSAQDVFSRMILGLRSVEMEEANFEAGRHELKALAALYPELTQINPLAKVKKEAFGDHPYAWGIADFLKRASVFNFEEVSQWKKQLVQNVHPYVIVSGDVEGTSFMKGIVSELSDPDFEVRPAKGEAPELPNEPEIPVAMISAEGNMLIGFITAKEGSDYNEMLDPALRILEFRLNREVAGKARNIFQAEVARNTEVLAGMVVVATQYPDGKQEEARDAIVREAREITEENMPRSELLNAFVRTIADFQLRQDDHQKYLRDTMRAVLAGETADYAKNYLLNIKQLRAGEVEAAVRRYLRSEN